MEGLAIKAVRWTLLLVVACCLPSSSLYAQKLVISEPALTVAEGESKELTVRLSIVPTGEVFVIVVNLDGVELGLDKTKLTFTPLNWNTGQTIRVLPAEDADSTDATARLVLIAEGGGYGGQEVNRQRIDLEMPGDTVQLAAEVIDQDGAALIGVPFIWDSTNPSVAVVNSIGKVTAVGDGVAGIRANWSAVAGLDPNRIVIDIPGANALIKVGGSDLSDREILELLYHSTGGEEWIMRDGWLTDAPLSEWHGVSASGGRVTHLDLHENNLQGQLPSELGGLSNLEWLYLSRNELTGQIPPELGGLSNLEELYLPHNELTGPIPPELGGLSNLTWLSLSDNELTGSIPPELGGLSNLTWLSLSRNELTGSIPPELGGLSNLEYLYLPHNELTGPIPPELGGLSKLKELELRNNELTGSIPPELGELSNLTGLWLLDNELTGSIPPELGGLSNLEELWLTGNELTGSIPPELGGLSNLTYLGLADNELTGSIPPELGGLSNLESLFLGWNDLFGRIPAEFGDLAKLEWLILRDNWYLNGPLPASLTNLESLRNLKMSATNLCIPRTTAFELWIENINIDVDRPCELVEEQNRNALKAIYTGAIGDSWSNNENWLTDAPLDDWYGVTANAADVVTELELTNNGLSGVLAFETANLLDLAILVLDGNPELGGEVPEQMLYLALLSSLRLEDTGLCLPGAKAFQDWLGRIDDSNVELCPDDHSNDASGATFLELGGSLEGKLESALDEDWFRLEIAEAGALHLESTGSTPLVGELYDDQNQELGIDSNGANLLIVTNVGPGTYYLRVYGNDRDTRGGYLINATFVP